MCISFRILLSTLPVIFMMLLAPAQAAEERGARTPVELIGDTAKAQVDQTARKRRIEVAFVVDTTGSMTNLIAGAKKKIWAIANSIVDRNPDAEIYFGLVAYRDIGDEYVTKHFELTTDIQGIYAHLLDFKADGGGDTPESVNEALDVAISKLGWSNHQQMRADRILFLVGDAPPHMDYQQDRKYPEVLKDAVKMGIIVNAVQAGNMRETTRVWKDIAARGKGEYLSIPQDGGRVIIIETPYDTEISRIQRELNTTIIIYGSKARQDKTRSKADMYESAAPAAAAEMSKYVSKSGKGKEVVTGGGDLVADVKGGKKLAEVPEAELPAEMRKMPPAEQARLIDEKAQKREILSRELAEKINLRDAYIKEQQAKEKEKGKNKPVTADSFDATVEKTLEKQIK